MMDHGIFVENFEKMMGISKTPENLIRMYDVLGVDYGLSYDLPAKLYLLAAVEYALAKLSGYDANLQIDSSVESVVYKISQEILSELDIRERKAQNNPLRGKLWRIVKRSMYLKGSRLRDLIEELSRICVRETCKRFRIQVKQLFNCSRFRILLPVVQGLFKEHIDECLELELKTLCDYGFKDAYIAIGTGGRRLSNDDKQKINYIIYRSYDLARRYKINVRLHLLGWSGPQNARGIDYSRIYSADSLTARRRASEGRIYVLRGDNVQLLHVSKIDRGTYVCNCPACRDDRLREYIFEPSCARKNDVRLIHNIYVLKLYLERSSKFSTLSQGK